MNKIYIRPISESDIADIQKYCFVQNTVDEVENRIKENLRKQSDGQIVQFVAEIDGHAVGTMMLSLQSHPLFAHRCVLEDVVVSGEYQGKGLARKIFDYCIDYCRKNKIKIITTGVRGGESAEQVYYKLGFVEYARLAGGIVEPWNDNKEYDEVLLSYTV